MPLFFRSVFFSFFMISTMAPANADINVVVSIKPVHSLVSGVMAGAGEPVLLIEGNQSPHNFVLRPSQAGQMQNADVVFWVGPQLETFLTKAVSSLSQGAVSTKLIENKKINQIALRGSHDHHDHGAGHGDAHKDEHDDEDKHAHEDEHKHDEHEHKKAAKAHDDEHEHDHKKDEHAHDDHADDHKEDEHKHDDHADDHKKNEHAHDDEHDHEKHADEDKHKHEEEHAHKDEHGHDDHDDHAKAKDDDHHDEEAEAGDPHIWLDPSNAIAMTQQIASVLAKADPENADRYDANAKSMVARLETLETELSEQLKPHAKAGFVVFHDAYAHFEHRFGLQKPEAISINPEVSPSAGVVKEVQETIEAKNITCLFSEPQFDDKILAVLAEKVSDNSARIGELDPHGSAFDAGPDHYFQTLRQMGKALSDCFAGS